MRSLWLLSLLALCMTLRPMVARADDPAASSPILTPPTLESFVPVRAPADAASVEGSVALVLSIDETGHVTEASVEQGISQPLDELAVAAARELVFKPATRDGVPMAARIRFRYAFAPPEPPPPPTPTWGEIHGIVSDRATNAPLAGAEVNVVASDGNVRSATTDANGSFAFSGLPAGTYAVQITSLAHEAQSSSEEVVAGERIEATYRLLAFAAATGAQFGAVARVQAPEREVVRRSIPKEELVRTAGTRGDPLRVVELLPGVARPPAGAGMVLVRGSAPGDSGVFLDGAPIYNLYHFGGLTSVANGYLLNGIDLIPGNFSARYGRKTGGVIETGFRDPRGDALHGVLDVNMIDASLLIETPINDEVSIALAARRSYLDAWLGPVLESSEVKVVAAPVYYDYQAILAYRPSARDKLRLLGYGSYDELALILNEPSENDPALRGKLSLINNIHRGQLEWHHDFSDRVDSDVTLAAGPYFQRGWLGPDVGNTIKALDVIGRGEVHVRMLRRLRLNAGVDGQLMWGHINYQAPALQQQEGDPSASGPLTGRTLESVETDATFARPAVYGEIVAQVSDRLELTVGTRIDYFSDIDAFSVDPRLNGKYVLGSTTLRAGAGLYSQPPDYLETIPGLGNPDLDPVRAVHFGAGVEQQLGEHGKVSLDGFYKRLSNLIVNGDAPSELVNRGKGRIYGLELMGRLNPVGRFSGFLAYTLSRSERNDGNGADYRLFDYDQTHILSASGNVKLGKNWLLGSTFRLASGNPDTPVVGSLYDADLDQYQPLYGRINSARNGTFHRLDVRVEKKWLVGRGSLTAYLDVQNLYSRMNPEGATYSFDYSKRDTIPGLPIIPSLGLRGEL